MVDFKKLCYKFVRSIRNKWRPDNDWFRGRLELLDDISTNQLLYKSILSGKPFFSGRLGSVEIKPVIYYNVLDHLSWFTNFDLYTRNDIDYIFNKKKYEQYMGGILQNNAGFFPTDLTSIKAFAEIYANDIKEIDICGCWLNEYLLSDLFNSDVQFCKLEHLEPYDYDVPWTKGLLGKRVLVISPFSDSIEKQYHKRSFLWENPYILPEFELLTIKAVQSIAHTPTEFSSWFEALDSMKDKMDCTQYDIALIGCGAYGLPLAAHAKRTGHQAIHLGGPLQILFGIKGKRWDDLPSVSKFYNEHWIRPSQNETPENKSLVENGCYW